VGNNGTKSHAKRLPAPGACPDRLLRGPLPHRPPRAGSSCTAGSCAGGSYAAGFCAGPGGGSCPGGLTDSLVKTDSVRPAAMAVISIATSMLSEIAGAFVIVGVPLIAAAWFAGPARLAVRARRALAPFLRDRPDWTFGIVAAIMAVIFIWQPIPATGTPVGIIVFLALALLGTVLLRRQTAEEFPHA